MAQFRSASREGSFSANQLVQPSTVDKIQAESKRQLAGMDANNRLLEKQRSMLLDAQKTAQSIQRQGAEDAFEVKQDEQIAAVKRSEESWRRQLANREKQDKFKVDTLGALVDFSKTAFDITSGIMKANKENQLKAINQVQFRNNFAYKDVVNAASIDQDITQSEYNQTNVVKQYIAEGKSQEFIDSMYEHLVKGGGYRNYMNNKAILANLGAENAQAIMFVANNKTLSIEEREKQIAALEAEQRANIKINGEIPRAEFLAVSYDPTIRQALSKSKEVLNGYKLDDLEEKNTRAERIVVNDLLGSGDGFSPEAVFNGVEGLPNRKGGITDAVKVMVTGRNLSPEDIAEIKNARFVVNNREVNLEEGGYTEALQMLDTQYDRSVRKVKERVALEQEQEKLEQQNYGIRLAQELAADGKVTTEEFESWQNTMDREFGRNRDRTQDEQLKNETVAAHLRPIIERDLERRALDGSLSRRYMMEQRIPLDLQNKYSQFADRNDQIKASPEYKDIDKNIRARVKGAMAGVKEFETLVEGKFQSDEAKWFLNEQTKKYRKVYFDAMVAGANQSELNSILDQAAYETAEYLKSDENFKPGVGIASYDRYMTESAKEQLTTQRKITSLERFFSNAWKRENPKELIKAVGEAPLVEAAEELRMTGSSVLIEHIGSRLKKTPIEVINDLAEVNDNIPPIVVPENYQQMLDNFTPAARFNFTSDLTTNEARLRQITTQLQHSTPMPRRGAYQIGDEVGSFPEGQASGALLDAVISGEGGYDSVNKGRAGDTPGGMPGLSSKTIGEVMELQRSGGLFAVGAPQFIPSTLNTALKDSGLSTEDRFSPENQRKMAFALMTGTKRPRLAAYLNGTSDDLNAAHEDLSLEWASVQGPSGRGAYDGDSAGNFAHTSGDSIRQLLIQAREENLNR